LEAVLQRGAAKARAIAAPLLAELRRAVGIGPFTADAPKADAKAEKAALPTFKQYREADGRFYFKLVSASGELLLQSQAFDQGRDAGQWVARLKREGWLAEAPATLVASEAAVRAALAAFADA
jgi:tryptophanyl-tRNA synthetase